MKRSRAFLAAAALSLAALAPGITQENTPVDYYSGAAGFSLDAMPRSVSWFVTLTGTNPKFKKLMITVKKTPSGAEEKDVVDIPDGAFTMKRLFRGGPGEYRVTLFGAVKKTDLSFTGICTFPVTVTAAIPDSVIKEEARRESEALDREARAAFDYLNAMRADPPAFSKEVGVSLAGIKPLPPLKWDSRLARSAKARAEDMAARNYFSHVNPEGLGPNHFAALQGYRFPANWPTGKSANNIESISAGPESGKEHVVNLINDGGAGNSSAGHRIHLLGLNSFFSAHSVAGVGMARNPKSTYGYYLVVHTAPAE